MERMGRGTRKAMGFGRAENGGGKGFSPRGGAALAEALCALSMGLNLVWCGLMGHTAGFAALTEAPVLGVNPRLFFLLGVLTLALAAAAVPGWLRHGDAVLRFAFPVAGAAGTACFSLLHDPSSAASVPVAAIGLYGTGIVYAWIVARCILMLMRTRGIGPVVRCLTGALVVRLVVAQVVWPAVNPAVHVACAVAAPLAAALSFECACAVLRRDFSEAAQAGSTGRTVFGIPQLVCTRAATSRADLFSMYLLLFIGAVVLAVARSISMFGVWGDASTSIADVAPWLLGVVVPAVAVVAFACFALLRMDGYALAARFQPALLLVFVGLFVTAVLESPQGSQVAGLSLVVQVGESWAHLLFWTIVATSLDVLGLPSYRSIGIGCTAYASLSIAWLLLLSERGMMATLLAVLAAYVVVIGLMCVAWNPLSARRGLRPASIGTAASGGAAVPGGGDGISGAPAGPDAAALPDAPSGTAGAEAPDGASAKVPASDQAASDPQRTMLDRCSELAERYALSPRETEVFSLLVQGRSRSFIQEELGLSGNTVKTHVSHIYAKMGVQGKQELMDLVWR